MNSSGNLISAGGGYSEDCPSGTNSVKIFEYNNGYWVQVSDNCTSGYQVIMSANGNSLSVKNGSYIKSYKYYSRNIWYVSNTNGSNANFGDEENPFGTIQYGIDWVNNGDTVLVEPGTYYENVNFNPNDYFRYPKNLTLASRFIFSNDETSIFSTIIDGSETSPVISIPSIQEGHINIVQGFKIQNGLGSNSGGGVDVDRAAAHIINCIIVNNSADYGGGVSFDQQSGGSEFSSILENCILFANEAYHQGGALSLVNSASNENANQIINSLFYNNIAPSGSAIRLWFANGETKLQNLTVSSNQGSYTIEIPNASAPPEIINCNIWGNLGNEPLFIIDPHGTNVSYSNIEGGYSGTGNLDTNPLFCDLSSYNFSLAENSPLVGAGQNGSNIGATDIGCDAFYDGPTWHVSLDGSDTNLGTRESPFRNIAYAMNHAELGDTILVQPGTYYENLDFGGVDKVLISEFYYNQDENYINTTIIDGDSNGTVISFEDYETNASVVCGFTTEALVSKSSNDITVPFESPSMIV
ncbi:uncharacterized protein METZ01_LOCUS215046, partial [marine metagenome]